jgi:hypothetical protein
MWLPVVRIHSKFPTFVSTETTSSPEKSRVTIDRLLQHVRQLAARVLLGVDPEFAEF